MGNGILTIKCSKCGAILVRGKTIVNAIKHYDINYSDNSIVAGIMCTNCGHYVSESKLKEVFEKWQKI